ncbi:hypothetical protein LOC68_15375 [Blastopirellula sp. JC732]|uniref:Uncharacterized protein n=1 Tax=Blastopirellula sediminis TaxID=2894196 RepID=A0A9X1SG30_9BACT|nr:hypothetical protein [Blastopirellula sediminis]MCC9606935.1 hypothetical protein [Blastopirellula sediminis]MCC9629770.1 hypothetical protein [Blastopirellula sediminis]
MHIRSLFFVLACLVFFTGCPSGQGSQGVGVTDPEVAQTVSNQVVEFVEGAAKSPKSAKGRLDLMLESLDGAAERGGEFVKVRDEAKKLQSMYEAKAGDAELKAQLETLKSAANALTASAS